MYFLSLTTTACSMVSLSPFIRGGNEGKERLSDLPLATQLTRDAATVQSQCRPAPHSATSSTVSAVRLFFTHTISFPLSNPPT